VPVYHLSDAGLFSIRAAKMEIVLRLTAAAATFLFLARNRDFQHRMRTRKLLRPAHVLLDAPAPSNAPVDDRRHRTQVRRDE
jgi:hypothetical protein